jgi:cyclophilin family peptidyl-prolyl cis-trans isomerase
MFHRVIPGFMAQGGDPKGTGEGGSDLPDIKAEFTTVPFLRGTVGAARAQAPDSANSQFFIMFVPNSTLDNDYTVVGRVVSGMDVVDRIAPGEPPPEPTKIVRAYLGG